MAIDANGDTSNEDSDPESDSEVSEIPLTREQLVLELEDLKECLFNQDKILKRAARERKELKAKLETALHDLEVLRSSPAVSDVPDCSECETHMTSLVSLKSKYANLVDELDKTKIALDETKTRSTLLSPCKSYFALKKELADARSGIEMLEKSSASSSRAALVDCDVCPALVQELHDFKYALTNV